MSETAQLGVRLYDVSVNLGCDNPELVEYLAGLMPGICGDPVPDADIEVVGSWIENPGPDHQRGSSLFRGVDSLSGFGKRMSLADDQLVWFDTHRDKDLQLRFRREAGKPVFEVAYCYRPSAKKAAKYPDYRQKKYFDLLRYLVYFPLAWYLERERGWTMIHASAVVRDGQAILVAGPGGAGKTTTCMALVARSGLGLLTENLLFSDGTSVYAIPEPIRLTGDSLELLSDALSALGARELPGGLRNKTMFWLEDGPRLDATPAAAVFLPHFTASAFVRPIPGDVAFEQLAAANRLTLELNDYYWYTAALDLLWPAPGNAQRQLDTLRRLTASTPCFALGICRAAGVDPVVDDVERCLTEVAS